MFRDSNTGTQKRGESSYIHGNYHWDSFVQSVLIPRINCESADKSRLITLGTPNAREIKNLLLRSFQIGVYRTDNAVHKEGRRLKLRFCDADDIAFKLSDYCGQNNISLNQLITYIESFVYDTNKNFLITSDNWNELIPRCSSAFRTALDELDDFIGLDKFKAAFKNRVGIAKYLSGGKINIPESYSRFSPPEKIASLKNTYDLNIVLSGDPGTGKSTIAKLIGRLYHELGLLSRGHFVAPGMNELLGRNEEETARNVNSLVRSAIGGVLFIDEIYSLVGDENMASTNLGQTAINQLTRDMSVYAGQLAFVIAGYETRMNDFFRRNEGLNSRFPQSGRYVLEPYDDDQLLRIFHKMANEKDLIVPGAIDSILPGFITAWRKDSKTSGTDKSKEWGNAREIENLINDISTSSAARYGNIEDHSEKRVISLDDFPERCRLYLNSVEKNYEEVLHELNDLVGLDNVKAFFKRVLNNMIYGAGHKEPGRYVFMGAPGSGKTEMGRRFSEILWKLGVIDKRTPVIKNAKNLLPSHRRDNSDRSPLREAVDEARGGILFIDEAHQLNEREGLPVITELVPLVEDPEIRADTGFIIAGYTANMRVFLDTDSGLNSRFPEINRIVFKDYTADELTKILYQMIVKSGNKTDDTLEDVFGGKNSAPSYDESADLPSEHMKKDGFLSRSRAVLNEFILNDKTPDFGNARFIRENYLPEAISARTERLHEFHGKGFNIDREIENAEGIKEEEKITLTYDDIPRKFRQYFNPVSIGRKIKNPENELEELIGKDSIIKYAKARKEMLESHYNRSGTNTDLIFTISGPVGAGKKTVATTLGKYWNYLGLLDTDEVRFVSKGDLEAGYVGQTAGQVRQVVAEIQGGTLVIVNPHAMLARDPGERSFGPEALGELIGCIGARRKDTSFVFIDSKENLEAVFMAFPSLKNLVTKSFELDDLSPSEMESIFRYKTSDNMVFAFDKPNIRGGNANNDDIISSDYLHDFFINWVSTRGGLGEKARLWGNGIEVDRLIKDIKMNWEVQKGDLDATGNSIIEESMFPESLRHYLKKASVDISNWEKNLDEIIGMNQVKERIKDKARHIENNPKSMPGKYIFMGPPGVGKTKMARYMGIMLKSVGALSQGHVVERTSSQLISSNADYWDELLNLAKGGVLFIDEAHMMAEFPLLVQKLLTTVENVNVMKNLCIILAGYEKEMSILLRKDRGLASRFQSSIIKFNSYTAEELLLIMKQMLEKASEMEEIASAGSLKSNRKFDEASLKLFAYFVKSGNTNFGNARFVRNYIADCYSELLKRLETDNKADESTLTEKDISRKYTDIIERMNDIYSSDLPKSVILTAPYPQKENTLKKLRDRASLSTVFLDIRKNGVSVGSGSGTIITKDGVILTCYHVANSEKDGDPMIDLNDEMKIFARVYTPNAIGGDYHEFECIKLEPGSYVFDMQLLKMKGTNFIHASLRPEGIDLDPSEDIALAGFPFGKRLNRDLDKLEMSLFKGTVSSIQNTNGNDLVYIDCNGKQGNSGSPVYSLVDGRVIGVFDGAIGSGNDYQEEINFYTPIKYFWQTFVKEKDESDTLSPEEGADK